VQIVVAEAVVGSAAEINGGAVVGEDEAIFLHGVEDDLIGRGKTGDIETGF